MRRLSIAETLARVGVTISSGVPCSVLATLPEYRETVSDRNGSYLPAGNEGDAVAVACGAYLGGGLGAVLLQNSGLGNAVNPLTSLANAYKIPLLLVIGWRGCPEDTEDDCQHKAMGRCTLPLLDELNIAYSLYPFEEEASEFFVKVRSAIGQRRSYALLVRRDGSTRVQPAHKSAGLDPKSVIECIGRTLATDDIVIGSTGYTAKLVADLRTSARRFPMSGSMGCASPIAVGIAAHHCAKGTGPRKIIVLDGDGALLMRLGNLALVGRTSLPVVHILLDNGSYESSGAQPTFSDSVCFENIARACGYAAAFAPASLDEIEQLCIADHVGPVFIRIRVGPHDSSAARRGHQSLPETAALLRQAFQ